ncbi:unnamed protein product [Pocillopora meandrina]|uniref:G-protein coupled receptors family 1 profile domain-containing protein n=1 Tax=Pocillopora meandrina TaxID=46732 RepID=A0AAU9Y313_9CNID|nr:unnamed protein product [Pocillopora meandrina]
MNTFEELVCSSSLAAFLGNSLILVALHKVSFLHPPSKLLYRSLATSDLLVGLVSQPLAATLWMSVVFEEWRLCRFAWVAAFISGYGLSLMSLLTMAAMSVDRLLALLLGLRYKQIAVYSALWVQLVLLACYVPMIVSLTAILGTNNLFTHFEQANADEEVSMCLLKEGSVIFTRSGTQTKTFVELLCTPSFGGGLHEIFTFFSAVHILLSITAFLTNSLILVALHKESSLHRPSKLLYRSLATTDLLVGLVAQPLYATYWMSLVQEHWSLCRYAFDAAYITGSALFLTSLMTMTAISVDRLLALLLGLRYKQIVTLKRTYIIVATIWILSLVTSLCALLDDRITFCTVS